LYSNRSAAYAAIFEWNNALADATKCVEIAPQWGKGYYRQGAAHEGMMKFPAALTAYEAGLRMDPRDPVLQQKLVHIQSILAEMNSVKPEQAKVNPEEDKYEAMINWLIAGKSRFPSLYLKYYSEDYRGVHTLSPVAKDEIVLEVPLSHIMTSEVAKVTLRTNRQQKLRVILHTHSFCLRLIYLLLPWIGKCDWSTVD
jgi:tetratricopeptide (TPR) repeat protein